MFEGDKTCGVLKINSESLKIYIEEDKLVNTSHC